MTTLNKILTQEDQVSRLLHCPFTKFNRAGTAIKKMASPLDDTLSRIKELSDSTKKATELINFMDNLGRII